MSRIDLIDKTDLKKTATTNLPNIPNRGIECM